MGSRTFLLSGALLMLFSAALGRVAFEKLTELDYRGSTYYTIRNLSLWECQGWCREEPECAAASFSFVMNPLAPVQETLCLLQNETMASNPSAQPQRAVSLYYMVKLSVRTDKVCNRPWTFERVPNKMIKGLDNALIFTSTKEACLASCLNERRFICRSAEYNYVTLQCHLSEHDRRSVTESVEMVDVQGVDFFENLCLGSSESCQGERDYIEPQFGVPVDRVSHYVDMHYYVDKELMANSDAACKRACEIENEFLCRSFLYKGPPTGNSYNCQLFHLDHYTLPDGPSTFLSTDRPLLDNGERTGTYYENACKNSRDNMICKQVTTRDNRYITQIMCFDKASISRQVNIEGVEMLGSLDGASGSTSGSTSGSRLHNGWFNKRWLYLRWHNQRWLYLRRLNSGGSISGGTTSGGSISGGSTSSGSISGGSTSSGSISGGSTSSGSISGGSTSSGSISGGSTSGGSISGGSTSSGSIAGGSTSSGSFGGSTSGGSFGGSTSGGGSFTGGSTGGGSFVSGSTSGGSSSSGSFGISTGTTSSGGVTSSPGSDNVNCDTTGVCYDVSVHCKDTRIVVEVATNQPFNGRIYALGRSETCNVQVTNSDRFRLDLSMAGQDCNTQSAGGVYTNTVVIQHHSIVMTKTDKIYKVRCTYDMTSKNITFGMLPISSSGQQGDQISEELIIRDPDMIPITSTPEAPPPKIRILDAALREVETVRIGDRLTFRIEIPSTTPYGIFARSCVAMAKDSRSTFQIIDDDGCPVEPSIFPQFTRDGSALQSVYEAFRFTESYGVIFQCNVKYCLGPCDPARCQIGREQIESWGRKRRGISSSSMRGARGHVQETTKEEALRAAALTSSTGGDEMSISQEILVLDLGDDQDPQYKENQQYDPYNEYYTNNTFTYEKADVTLFETCPTRSSVLALAVTCAILLLIYVLTVFYFVMRKWFRPPKNLR
ncbi:uncharacterized protein LOC135223045 [Macrobrachium nipponense]|uniref:uncharacterized protein LOC135223045 n=1 Tax=Macrobrachium nipponense TaxID=159736 RepID=UPI0030C7B7E5